MAMKAAGVSVSALARHCDVSRTTVQKWRKQDKAHLSVGDLLLIDGKLKTNLRWLASGDASPVRTYVELALLS